MNQGMESVRMRAFSAASRFGCVPVGGGRYLVIMGCCARDRLCDRCLSDQFAQLRGVAACRGEWWATRVAMRVARRDPWPELDNPRCYRIARAKVADLTRDERLADQLARIVHGWAAKRWQQQLGR